MAESRAEGARDAARHLTVLLLRQRFGDDPRVEAVAARWADLADEERVARLAALTDLDDAQP